MPFFGKQEGQSKGRHHFCEKRGNTREKDPRRKRAGEFRRQLGVIHWIEEIRLFRFIILVSEFFWDFCVFLSVNYEFSG